MTIADLHCAIHVSVMADVELHPSIKKKDLGYIIQKQNANLRLKSNESKALEARICDRKPKGTFNTNSTAENHKQTMIAHDIKYLFRVFIY